MQHAYFISDVHLAIKVNEREQERRDELFELLDKVKSEAATLIIVGDFFDFYFEWGPKVIDAYGDVYQRLKDLVDSGIDVHYIAGNHDFWLGRFLRDELGIHIYLDPTEIMLNDHRFYCIHGDGLSKSDWKYRIFKAIIRSRISTALFRWLVPMSLGKWLAEQVSYTSRKLTKETLDSLNALIDENLGYAREYFDQGYDFFVTGHIHLPRLAEEENGTFLTIGDFLQHFSYGYYDGVNLSLKQWPVKSLPQRLLA